MYNNQNDQYIAEQPTMNVPATLEAGSGKSIFLSFADFGSLMQMADVLAKSSFVPKALAGRTADCAIVLDLANTFNINVMTMLNNVHFINGRPGLSTVLMIALVNNSGKYTQVTWDEGVDGTVETSRGPVPNYYATASFCRVADGKKLESIRVDMEMAYRAGWAQRNPLWTTISKVMCRWRSAAWLIKNFAPEIALGLNFAEELTDSNGKPVYVETTVTREQEQPENEEIAEWIENGKDVDNLMNELSTASTQDELLEVARKIATMNITTAEKEKLRKVFIARKNELSQEVVEEEGQPEIEEEQVEKPKRGRRPKKAVQAEEQATEDVRTPSELLAEEIDNTDSAEALASLQNRVNSAHEDGAISDAETKTLHFIIERKLNSLSAVAPTDEQKRWAGNLVENIRARKTIEEVDMQVKVAQEWRDEGYITAEQLCKICEVAESVKQTL